MADIKTITNFKAADRRSRRFEVWLDGELWTVLEAETIVRRNLSRGQELDAARQKAVLAEDAALRARMSAAAHAMRSPRSEREIADHLRRKGFDDAAIQTAIQWLSETGTVDDDSAAEKIARMRRRGRLGPRRIEAELRARGIAPGIAAEQTRRCMEGTDALAECEAQARKRAARLEPLDNPRNRQKLVQFLMRRGWESETIRTVLARIGGSLDADEISAD